MKRIALTISLFLFLQLYSNVDPRWIDIPKFEHLFSKPIPTWMKEEISSDFKDFYARGITQEALKATQDRAFHRMFAPWKGLAVGSITRYRTINGRIFRQGTFGTQAQFYLRILARAGRLPNVDVIFSEVDGTPEYYHTPNFWVTPDFKDQAPILARATMKEAPFIVKIPDNQTFMEWWHLSETILRANQRYPWERKKNVAVWRGNTSDIHINNANELSVEVLLERYKTRPRYLICELSRQYPHLVDAGFNYSIPFDAISIAISGLRKPGIDCPEHIDYKYLPIMDGWSCTYPGYIWRLASNSVAMKVDSPCIQWFYNALKPYVHYIPIQSRLEDFLEKLEWAKSHDIECRKIAENATAFVVENLMPEHIWYYYALVLQEYASLQQFNVEDFLYECEHSGEWSEYIE